jgi:subtilisin family serine protease
MAVRARVVLGGAVKESAAEIAGAEAASMTTAAIGSTAPAAATATTANFLIQHHRTFRGGSSRSFWSEWFAGKKRQYVVLGRIWTSSGYFSATGDSRIPVQVCLEAPDRPSDADCECDYGRRPVVAVLDTGVRAHTWLGIVRNPPGTPGYDILADASVQVNLTMQQMMYNIDFAAQQAGDKPRVLIADPWDAPVTSDPLVGDVNDALGHGTAIAGIFRQAVPAATVLSVRIMHSDDFVYEGDLVTALNLVSAQVALAQDQAQPKPDLMVDAVSLSFGYFCESSKDVAYSSVLKGAIDALLAQGVMIVAAAGNASVSRRFYPAAFADAPYPAGTIPLYSVGALNPNRSRAVFSDDGCWVTAWAPGAMLITTFPTDVNGALQPTVEEHANGQHRWTREGLDPDDFRSGFVSWNGTSFAAPALAAWLFQAMLKAAAHGGPKLSGSTAADAIARVSHAITCRQRQES